jgi:hypothetical protein
VDPSLYGAAPDFRTTVLSALLASTLSVFRTRVALQLQIIALRHQLGVLQRSVKRPKFNRFDRFLWAWFCGAWNEWRSALCIVKPDTVIAWHRKGFRLFWTWKVRRGQRGRPPVSKEIRKLIRKMSRDNPLWGLLASTVNSSSSALTSARPA